MEYSVTKAIQIASQSVSLKKCTVKMNVVVIAVSSVTSSVS